MSSAEAAFDLIRLGQTGLVNVDTGEIVEITGVHPVADLFPMLDDEELDSLAANIETNGLIDPVVVLVDGTLVDGRNRMTAGARRNLTLTCTVLDLADPVTYIISKNIARRNITKGQQAMIVARACLEIKQTTRAAAKQHGVNLGRLGTANTVIGHASDLVNGVLAGTTSLDAAYKIALDRKQAADTDVSRMDVLRKDASDLADLVIEERMTLAEAVTVAAARERKLVEERRDARNLLIRIIDLTVPHAIDNGFVEGWAQHLGDVEPELIERIHDAVRVLTDLAKRVQP